MTWDDQKRARFQWLRSQVSQLPESEQAELSQLTRELEEAEAATLTPAIERMRQERERIEAQNHTLEALTQRKMALVSRLREFLTATQAERAAIDGELAAVLAGERGLDTDR